MFFLVFFSVFAAQKGVRTIISKSGSHIDLGLLSVQLSKYYDDVYFLGLAIAKESKRT